MSTPLAEAVAEFTTSVVCGKDVVPRTSVANIGRLLDDMVRSVHGTHRLCSAGCEGQHAGSTQLPVRAGQLRAGHVLAGLSAARCCWRPCYRKVGHAAVAQQGRATHKQSRAARLPP